jgi:hypothetical protein
MVAKTQVSILNTHNLKLNISSDPARQAFLFITFKSKLEQHLLWKVPAIFQVKQVKEALKILDSSDDEDIIKKGKKVIKDFNEADRIASSILTDAIPDAVSGQIVSNSLDVNSLKLSQLDFEQDNDEEEDFNYINSGDIDNYEVKFIFHNYLSELERRYLCLNKMETIKLKMETMTNQIGNGEKYDDFVENLRQKIATIKVTGGSIMEEEMVYGLCTAMEKRNKQLSISIMGKSNIKFEEAIKMFRNGDINSSSASTTVSTNNNGNEANNSNNNVINMTKTKPNKFKKFHNYNNYKSKYVNNGINNKFNNRYKKANMDTAYHSNYYHYNENNNNRKRSYGNYNNYQNSNTNFRNNNQYNNWNNNYTNRYNDDALEISRKYRRVHILINNIKNSNYDQKLILDSGAEISVFNKTYSGMSNIQQSFNKTISYGNGLTSSINATARIGILPEVAVCKELNSSIVSISSLADMGYNTVITSKGTYVLHNNIKIPLDENDVMLYAPRKDGLYMCDTHEFIDVMNNANAL